MTKSVECVIVPVGDLSSEHRATWSGFLRRNAQWDVPQFQPEFVCGLAKCIPDCKVAIIHRGSEIIGYLPFQQTKWGVARTIPLCDYQAIIGTPDILDMREVIRLAGLRSWIFQNLPEAQIPRDATYLSKSLSLRAELHDGFEAYQTQLAEAGKSARHLFNNIRRLQRSHGPISLHHGVADTAVLSRLLGLKAERYIPDGQVPDSMTRTLLYFHRRTTGPLTGLLSVMKAADKHVAYIFSVKFNDLLYYWFPAFEPQYGQYSPGMIMLWLLMKDLKVLGCTKIDFGPGHQNYKEYFANCYIEVACGRLDANESVAIARRWYRYIRSRVRADS